MAALSLHMFLVFVSAFGSVHFTSIDHGVRINSAYVRKKEKNQRRQPTSKSTIFFIQRVKLFSFRMARFTDPANKSYHSYLHFI